MKKFFLALLACLLLAATVSAAWSPVDFAGGSLSGIAASDEGLLVSDVFNKVVWRVTDEGVEQLVGRISIPGLDGEPIGKYDDGTLDTALFMEPWAMAPFLDGYAITDTEAHAVRYFDEEGVFTAGGDGKAGSRDGTGTSAKFNRPTGLAADSSGKLYIADTGNGSIRVMSRKGKVTTLVTGLVEPTGLCWYDGALYVAETGRSRVLRIVDGDIQVIAGASTLVDGDGVYSTGYVDGPAGKARFDHPQGIAVGDDGVIYVADTGNQAVRKIRDGYVTTLASSQDSPLAPVMPRGLLCAGDTLTVTDLFAQNLLTVDLSPVSYSDLPATHWAAGFVAATTERGITIGDGGAFFPDAEVNRAAFAVMISRLHQHSDGSAVINGSASFADVADVTWYGDAVRWAAGRGIIQGDGVNFFPNQSITREQLVTMLYRYAQSMGYDVPAGEEAVLLSYSDASKISEYALPAMRWACGAGILSGDGGSLDPQGYATRAQTAKMLITAMDAWGV